MKSKSTYSLNGHVAKLWPTPTKSSRKLWRTRWAIALQAESEIDVESLSADLNRRVSQQLRKHLAMIFAQRQTDLACELDEIVRHENMAIVIKRADSSNIELEITTTQKSYSDEYLSLYSFILQYLDERFSGIKSIEGQQPSVWLR